MFTKTLFLLIFVAFSKCLQISAEDFDPRFPQKFFGKENYRYAERRLNSRRIQWNPQNQENAEISDQIVVNFGAKDGSVNTRRRFGEAPPTSAPCEAATTEAPKKWYEKGLDGVKGAADAVKGVTRGVWSSVRGTADIVWSSVLLLFSSNEQKDRIAAEKTKAIVNSLFP